jgi:hypothetical protein
MPDPKTVTLIDPLATRLILCAVLKPKMSLESISVKLLKRIPAETNNRWDLSIFWLNLELRQVSDIHSLDSACVPPLLIPGVSQPRANLAPYRARDNDPVTAELLLNDTLAKAVS